MGKSWSLEHRGPPAIVRMVRITKAQRPIWAKVGCKGIADQGDRTNIMAQSQYGQKVCHASWHKANMGKGLEHRCHHRQRSKPPVLVGKGRNHRCHLGQKVRTAGKSSTKGRSRERSLDHQLWHICRPIWAKGRSRERSRTPPAMARSLLGIR